jgi:nucleotide-binding universal stress UspA family protein
MGRKPLGPWVVAGADALSAVDMAAAEATMRGLRLRLVVSCPQGSRSAGAAAALAALVDANRAAAEAASRAHLRSPDLTVSTLVVAGDLAGALIRESNTAAVVVVGDGPRPGSAWTRVASHAHCPAVVVSSSVDGMAGMFDAPVMVGVAAAGWDDAAMGFAFDEAAARGVPLRVAHLCPGVPDAGIGCVDPIGYELRNAMAAAHRRLAEAVAGWAEKYPQVPVERVSLHDLSPADALVRASGGAGLVVVGASLHAPSSGQALGIVTQALVERAGRPVCVVRNAGR